MSIPAKRPPIAWLWITLARFAIAVGATVLIVSLLSAAVHVSPGKAVPALVGGAFGSRFAWHETIIRSIPICLTGLGVAWAFRAGLFNIGAEGQLLWGALAAAWIGAALRLPPVIHVPACLLAGSVAGALWAAPAAWLKSKRGTPEVVTTLLLNFLAANLTRFLANNPLHDPSEQGARTVAIAASAELPLLSGRLHAGVLIALAASLVLAALLVRARFGFQLRAVGQNPNASRSSGMAVGRIHTAVLLQSGALAGLAGAIEALGVHHRFISDFSPGYGYEGIAVAILGASAPLGVAAAALFWGALANGAVELELSTGMSRYLVTVIQALVVLAVAVRRWPFHMPRRAAASTCQGKLEG